MRLRDCLCFALGKATRAMARAYRERLEPLGITQPQFFLLIALFEGDEVTVSELGARVAMDKSTLTGILDRLERDGLVERVENPSDGRSFVVRLTARARELEARLRAVYEETNAAFLSRLTSEERQVVQQVVAKLEEDIHG